eukprot:SAG31_NODE_122_length_23797_cov_39.343812_11_plen_104_part_00
MATFKVVHGSGKSCRIGGVWSIRSCALTNAFVGGNYHILQLPSPPPPPPHTHTKFTPLIPAAVARPAGMRADTRGHEPRRAECVPGTRVLVSGSTAVHCTAGA